ncbi:hypothetical protein QUA27_08630 [Microcoleus sp. Pol14C6]|uniref:hypothetical protein n=1 Tax=unclassified Microcoleus TaxID=2642155 RepID=UPI002FCFA3D2
MTSVQGRAIAGNFSLPVKSLLHQQYELFSRPSFGSTTKNRDAPSIPTSIELLSSIRYIPIACNGSRTSFC